jgi:putative phage-type endonuclease
VTETTLNELEQQRHTLQRTEEWLAARRGKVTASRIYDILKTIRSGAFAASRKNYAAELVRERLTGNSLEPVSNEYTEWGVEQEPAARAAYEKVKNVSVTEVGFVNHPTIEMSGASPDGLVGEDGMIEIKCPTTATHIATLLGGELNEQYRYQMLWQLACCPERQWVDFMSFDPRMPEDMQCFIARIERDNEEIAEVESEVKAFLKEVDETIEALTKKYRTPIEEF